MDTFDVLDPRTADILYQTIIGQAGIGGWIVFVVSICMEWLCSSLLLIRFLSKNFGFRRSVHPVLGYTVGALLLFAASVVNWYIQVYWQMSVGAIIGPTIHFLVLLLFALLFLRGSVCEKLFMAIICKTLESIAVHIRDFLYALDELQALKGAAFIIDQLVFDLVGLLLLFLLLELFLHFHQRSPGDLRSSEWLILSTAFLMTWMLNFGMNRFSEERLFLFVAVIDLLLFIFARKLHMAAHLEHEQKLSAVRMEQQQQEIDSMEEQHRALSILRHDTVHRMICIRELLRQGETERASAYIDEFVGSQSSIPHICSSSIVVNAVINTKFSEAQNLGIEASCRMTVKIPQALEYDLSILLSNLLDNALEACRKCENSEIIVSMAESGGYYRLDVSNTILESVLSENPSLTTDKADTSRHGWGLRSVSEIAAAHEGTVHFSEKNGMFVASVLLMKP